MSLLAWYPRPLFFIFFWGIPGYGPIFAYEGRFRSIQTSLEFLYLSQCFNARLRFVLENVFPKIMFFRRTIEIGIILQNVRYSITQITSNAFFFAHRLAYLAANVLRARRRAPNFHKMNIPAIPMIARPARRLTPPPIPKVMNIGLENITHPAANAARKRSFPAKSDAAYCGYESGRYTNTHWKMMKFEVTRITTPIIDTIQCTEARAVHPMQASVSQILSSRGPERTYQTWNIQPGAEQRRKGLVLSGARVLEARASGYQAGDNKVGSYWRLWHQAGKQFQL